MFYNENIKYDNNWYPCIYIYSHFYFYGGVSWICIFLSRSISYQISEWCDIHFWWLLLIKHIWQFFCSSENGICVKITRLISNMYKLNTVEISYRQHIYKAFSWRKKTHTHAKRQRSGFWWCPYDLRIDRPEQTRKVTLTLPCSSDRFFV